MLNFELPMSLFLKNSFIMCTYEKTYQKNLKNTYIFKISDIYITATKYSLVFIVFELSKRGVKLHIIWGPVFFSLCGRPLCRSVPVGVGCLLDWLWGVAGWVA